jgi:hypothetical protein
MNSAVLFMDESGFRLVNLQKALTLGRVHAGVIGRNSVTVAGHFTVLEDDTLLALEQVGIFRQLIDALDEHVTLPVRLELDLIDGRASGFEEHRDSLGCY